MRRSALISTFGTTGLVLALTLFTSVVVARFLGPEGRGALLALTIWPATLSGILGLSLNEATSYHLARASAVEGEDGARRYAASGLVLQSILVLLVVPLSLVLLPYLLPSSWSGYLPTVLLFALTYTPVALLDQHFKAVLQGHGQFHALSVVRVIQPIVYAMALLVLVLGNRLTVETVLAVTVLGIAVSMMVSGVMAGVEIKQVSVAAMKDSVATGLRFHGANLLIFAATEADKLIVLRLLGGTEIGYYAVAVAVSSLGSSVVVQSLTVMMSRDMAASTTPAQQGRVLVRNLQAAVLLLFAVNGIGALLAPWWLPMLFGADFAAAVPVTVILMLGGFAKGLRQIFDRAMRSLQISRIGAIGEAVALAGLIPLGFIGSRIAGLEGFASGLVCAQVTSLAIMAWLATRALGMRGAELLELHRDGIADLGRVTGRELRAFRDWIRC